MSGELESDSDQPALRNPAKYVMENSRHVKAFAFTMLHFIHQEPEEEGETAIGRLW